MLPHVWVQWGQRYAVPCLCVCGLVSHVVEHGFARAAKARSAVSVIIANFMFVVLVFVVGLRGRGKWCLAP